jgi:hypothetical protein
MSENERQFELPGYWFGYVVDVNGDYHELAREETLEDAHRVAWRRWQRPFTTMGVVHEHWIEDTRRNHKGTSV